MRLFFIVFCALATNSCFSSILGQDGPTEIKRTKLELVDCGLTGSLPVRLADCRRLNPVYSKVHAGGDVDWLLVMTNSNMRLEYWIDNRTGVVWSNGMTFKEGGCELLEPIDNGDRAMTFEVPSHVQYLTVFKHGFPKVIQSERSQYFVMLDSERNGHVVNEHNRTFSVAKDEVNFWMRCAAQ